jgi:hypothetical protein
MLYPISCGALGGLLPVAPHILELGRAKAQVSGGISIYGYLAPRVSNQGSVGPTWASLSVQYPGLNCLPQLLVIYVDGLIIFSTTPY